MDLLSLIVHIKLINSKTDRSNFDLDASNISDGKLSVR